MKRIKGIGVACIRGDEGRFGLRVYSSSPLPRSDSLTLAPFTRTFQIDAVGRMAVRALGGSLVTQGVDLDLRITDHQLDAAEQWFYSRTGRSTSLLPNMMDMLFTLRVLRNVDRENGATEHFLHSLSYHARTDPDGPIIYFIDLFELKLRPDTTEYMLSNGSLYFATEEELRSGRTRHGSLISNMAGAVLL